jgi:hypothetical protein
MKVFEMLLRLVGKAVALIRTLDVGAVWPLLTRPSVSLRPDYFLSELDTSYNLYMLLDFIPMTKTRLVFSHICSISKLHFA